jgi:uncharacterized protein (TIGR00266 family)
MKFRIIGNAMQALDLLLMQGESIFTEVGGMAWYKGHIKMETNMPGGLMSGLGRMVAGESIFLTTYQCLGENAEITFTPESPGAIVQIQLAEGQSVICQRDSFMVGQQGVQLAIHFKQRLGVGLFGGEGFILQRVTGPGMAFFEVDGEVREMELAAGEVLHVDPGHIAIMDATVTHSIERVKGVKNMLFGGEGLFLATLTGPGRVWLQTMPLNNLIDKIVARMPKTSS